MGKNCGVVAQGGLKCDPRWWRRLGLGLLSIGGVLGSRWRRVLTMECRWLIASTCIFRAHFLAWYVLIPSFFMLSRVWEV